MKIKIILIAIMMILCGCSISGNTLKVFAISNTVDLDSDVRSETEKTTNRRK